MQKTKTIASIVTPPGEGGIGKIVVSGQYALRIVNTVFKGKGIADLRDAVSQRLYYGHIFHDGRHLDEVILNVVKQEDSDTGEDIVEVNCHGGIRVLRCVYDAILSAGAKDVSSETLLTQSMKNNKIDIIQKEAAREIVEARTKLCVKVLLDQYTGALSNEVKLLLRITGEIMRPENEEMCRVNNDSAVSALEMKVKVLLGTAPFGIALTNPQVLVILGKPNVGKSTIINAFLGEEQVLVHHEPGTTRDYVSEIISIDGIPFEIVDTAGIRHTNDELEHLSIEITQEQLLRSDKVLVVFDNSRPLDTEDFKIVELVNSWLFSKVSAETRKNPGENSVVPVINKSDLPGMIERKILETQLGLPVCSISAKSYDGLDLVHKRLLQEFDVVYKPKKPVVFNERQHSLLTKAYSIIQQIKKALSIESQKDTLNKLVKELENNFVSVRFM